jgi:hypothetical protein
MPLREELSEYWLTIQGELFPWLEEELGPLTEKHKQLITVLEMARIEIFVQTWHGLPGRPLADRRALCRAFVAKAVLGLTTTVLLIERLKVDTSLRQLCGWERLGHVPSESTFSRAFSEFAYSALPSEIHAALIARTHKDRLVGHIARDSTAIEAREKPVCVEKPKRPKRKRGRPKKGEEVKKPKRRLECQRGMTLAAMLADLPQHCAVGTKRNAKGHKTSWIGYKLHIDVADGDIPVSCLLTSASLHDSQAAIPLALTTAGRVTNLYDLMDTAYDAPEIKATSRDLGHVPIIDPHPRNIKGGKAEKAAELERQRRVSHCPPETIRFNERSAAERVNGRVKDDFGGRNLRVRGAAKVMGHLMFGILALTVDQLIRLII